jgi:hypothetical protein
VEDAGTDVCSRLAASSMEACVSSRRFFCKPSFSRHRLIATVKVKKSFPSDNSYGRQFVHLRQRRFHYRARTVFAPAAYFIYALLSCVATSTTACFILLLKD